MILKLTRIIVIGLKLNKITDKITTTFNQQCFSAENNILNGTNRDSLHQSSLSQLQCQINHDPLCVRCWLMQGSSVNYSIILTPLVL